MLAARLILGITAMVWICYGGWLFFDPKGLAYMGYGLDNWSAIVEVQAMYGAAEFALGVFALMGILYPKRYMHPALMLWFMFYSALVIGRVVGIIQWDGSFGMAFGPEGLPESYNPGAMYFLEIPSAIWCWIAMRKIRNAPELQ